jgi:DNA replication and repair protein RecF
VRLEALKLLNFRNFAQVDITFPYRANLFLGRNGAGKTNLLESIGYLSFAKSYRGAKDRDLVMFGEESFRIDGRGRGTDREFRIEIAFTPIEKRISLNASRLAATELVGNFPVVWLSSDDIETTRGTPRLRRRFVDMILSYLRPSYFKALVDYRRVLHQRNRALVSDGRTYEAIEPWDSQLIELGSDLIKSRKIFAGDLARLASKYYTEIAPDNEEYILSYVPSIPLDGSSIEASFSDRLMKTKRMERERGVTLVGPHRDDYTQELDGRDMRRFASEGQQRTASMSLKLAGAELVYEKSGEWPVMILDEVFAELDRERCGGVVKMMGDLDQVFVATATADSVPDFDSHAFLVEGGTVRSLE